MAKTAQVWIGNDTDGRAVEAKQLATFAHYIKGHQYRFVVTSQDGCGPVVTHRLSGLQVCEMHNLKLGADFVPSAVAAIKSLVSRLGEDRVDDVLSRAEKMGYGLMRGKAA